MVGPLSSLSTAPNRINEINESKIKFGILMFSIFLRVFRFRKSLMLS